MHLAAPVCHDPGNYFGLYVRFLDDGTLQAASTTFDGVLGKKVGGSHPRCTSLSHQAIVLARSDTDHVVCAPDRVNRSPKTKGCFRCNVTISSGKNKRRILGVHDESVQQILLTRDGMIASSLDVNDTLKVWDTSSGDLLWELQGTKRMAFDNAGRRLATATLEATQIRDARSGEVLQQLCSTPPS